jgi:hypothetical protein
MIIERILRAFSTLLLLACIAVLPAFLLMVVVLWSMQFELRDVPDYFVKTVIDIGPIPFYLVFGLYFFFFAIKWLIARLAR